MDSRFEINAWSYSTKASPQINNKVADGTLRILIGSR
jgi:hypothetical protein